MPLNGLHSQIERDLILTPKLALQINGKTLYYKPSTSIVNPNITSTHVPWEQTLKHVTFLTLHSDLNEVKDINNYIDYKNFMNSLYISSNNSYIPKFGDIITLAHGCLKNLTNNNEYYFIEGQCNNYKNILAYWQVQKIRHRDIDQKFRYEIKFSVNPKVNINVETNGKREINNNNRFPRQSLTLKSFILKDNDYPKSFNYVDDHIAQRRYDEDRHIYLERLNAFNDVFTNPRYFDMNRNLAGEYNRKNNNLHDLNIGEYILPNRKNFMYRPDSLSTNPVYNNLPTTYRPNYHLKFTKQYTNPNTYYSQNEQSSINYPQDIYNKQKINDNKIPTTTHLHHHFYLKNHQNKETEHQSEQEQQITIESKYEQNNHQDTIDLIQWPLSTLSAPKASSHSPSPPPVFNQLPIPPYEHNPPNSNDQHVYDNNQNPILQSPSLFYMHPIPISPQLPLYVFPNTNQYRNDQPSTPPFRESYRIENQIQYSEPDPLFKNIREYKENYKTNKYVQTEMTKVYDNIANKEKTSINSDIVENIKQNDDENYTKPDSINAQLPPPDDATDLTVPYVENINAITQSSLESSSQLFVQKQIEEPTSPTIIPSSILATTTTTSPVYKAMKILPNLKRSNNLEKSNLTNPKNLVSELFGQILDKPINVKKNIRISPTLQSKLNNINNISQSSNLHTDSTLLKYLKPTTNQSTANQSIVQNIAENNKSILTTKKYYHHRSTTERPVLKWKPKRAKITKESKPNFSATTRSSTSKFEFERVPVNVTERVFTVTPSNKNNISTKKSVSKSVSIKIGKEDKAKPFTPKVKIPNVEVYEADIIKLNTTEKGIKFFKAFSGRDEIEKTKENDVVEAELTKSIVEHVKSL